MVTGTVLILRVHKPDDKHKCFTPCSTSCCRCCFFHHLSVHISTQISVPLKQQHFKHGLRPPCNFRSIVNERLNGKHWSICSAYIYQCAFFLPVPTKRRKGRITQKPSMYKVTCPLLVMLQKQNTICHISTKTHSNTCWTVSCFKEWLKQCKSLKGQLQQTLTLATLITNVVLKQSWQICNY